MTSPGFILATRLSMFGPMQSGRKDHVLSEQPSQPLRDGRQAEFWIELALGAAEVRAENDFAAVVDHTVDGRKRGTDPGVVGDLQGIVEGHVEIGADDDPLAGQRHVVDRLLMQIHGRSLWVSVERADESCGKVRAHRPLDFAARTLIRSRTRHE